MKRMAFAALAFLTPTLASAQEAAPASETSVFVFNTLFLLAAGIFALVIVAGFTMIEAGLVRSKNAAAISLQNLVAYALAAAMFWLTGYNLWHGVEPGGFLGDFAMWSPRDLDPVAVGAASASRFFFETGYVAIAAAIVAGALAERLRLSALVVFTGFLAGLILPVAASWSWGKGYLAADWKFYDYAGATVVHAVGGAAALAGALVIGPRRGKYHGRRVTPLPGSNLPLAALGALLVWIGLLVFAAAGEGGVASVGDALAVSSAMVKVNIGAAGGVLAAMVMTSLIYKRIDLTIVLNGAVGGLVSLSADPLSPALWQAALVGAMGGVIVTVGAPMLDRLKIDDVVGAIPAHLFCGVWGTLIIAWTNPEAALLGQIVGVLMICGFAFAMSALVWIALRFSIGARPPADQEIAGLDRAELGLEAYPEFRRN